MPDVRLSQRAEKGVANRVHQCVRVRVAVQTFRVWNLHAPEDQLAPGHQLMNVIPDAYVNHAARITTGPAAENDFIRTAV